MTVTVLLWADDNETRKSKSVVSGASPSLWVTSVIARLTSLSTIVYVKVSRVPRLPLTSPLNSSSIVSSDSLSLSLTMVRSKVWVCTPLNTSVPVPPTVKSPGGTAPTFAVPPLTE